MSDTLYDTDFYEWTQEQSRRLRKAASGRINVPIDWENVAEEIESLEKSNVSSARSHVARIIEHFLKLEHSPAAPPRSDWQHSITLHRSEVLMLLEDSPSIRGQLSNSLEKAWLSGRRFSRLGLQQDGIADEELPGTCPYAIEQVLDLDWFPKTRHGLG
jgi:hypothetical protein